MAYPLRMPAIAADSAEAVIQAWLVQPGEQLDAGQPVAEIETEKAVVDYESEHSGVLAGVLVAAGDSAAVGQIIGVVADPAEPIEEAMLSARGDTIVEPDKSTDEGTASAATTAAQEPSLDRVVAREDHVRRFASPLVRRIARDQGIDVNQLDGSGPGGRIVRRDLERYTESSQASSTDIGGQVVDEKAAEAAGPGESSAGFNEVPHSSMRRLIARRLTESKQHVPHFYLRADCLVANLLELREQINQSASCPVTINDLVVKATAGTMTAVPEANAIWTDTAVRTFSTVDIGIAVAVEGGLATPVIRDVGSLPTSLLAAATRDLTERARAGRLRQQELEGGTFTVTNLGMFKVQEFSAIINPPHAGILAVGEIARRPIVDGDDLRAAEVMTVTLSVDHRVLDGATAANWLRTFVELIEDPVRILI